MQRLIIKLNLVVDTRLQSYQLVVQLLGFDALFEQLFAVFDAPQNLASVVIHLLVELGRRFVQLLLVLDDAVRLLLKLLCDEA